MCMYRQKSRSSFFNVRVNMPGSNRSLKYGFWWLGEQPTVDTVIVDAKTNASVLEHLVFMYDLLAQCLC